MPTDILINTCWSGKQYLMKKLTVSTITPKIDFTIFLSLSLFCFCQSFFNCWKSLVLVFHSFNQISSSHCFFFYLYKPWSNTKLCLFYFERQPKLIYVKLTTGTHLFKTFSVDIWDLTWAYLIFWHHEPTNEIG